MRGAIAYFDGGVLTRQARVTIYRRFPSRIRVEVEEDGAVEAWGMNPAQVWKLGQPMMSEEEQREVRNWLRFWPEWLFLARAAEARYREVGRVIEEPRPQRAARFLDQVEIQDRIEKPGGGFDRRLVYYQVASEGGTIDSVRWLEPDDPRREADDPGAAKMEVRVDFGRWRRVEGVLWPTEITHWLGGRIDFRIQLEEVLVNEQLAESIFQDPSR
jgi:hypothetical protein